MKVEGAMDEIEKILRDKIQNVPIGSDWDRTRVCYLNDGAIVSLSKSIKRMILEARIEDCIWCLGGSNDNGQKYITKHIEKLNKELEELEK